MPVKRDDADLALTILEKLAFDSPKGKLRITIVTDFSFGFRFSSWPSCHSDSQYIQLALVQCFVRHSGKYKIFQDFFPARESASGGTFP